MATCNLDIPGNLAGGRGASIAVNGSEVVVSGSDLHHQSRLIFDVDKAGYTHLDSWTAGLAGWNRDVVLGGTQKSRHMANEIQVCGRQVAAQGDGTTAAILARLARSLRK